MVLNRTKDTPRPLVRTLSQELPQFAPSETYREAQNKQNKHKNHVRVSYLGENTDQSPTGGTSLTSEPLPHNVGVLYGDEETTSAGAAAEAPTPPTPREQSEIGITDEDVPSHVRAERRRLLLRYHMVIDNPPGFFIPSERLYT
jgi:hypothetical protein